MNWGPIGLLATLAGCFEYNPSGAEDTSIAPESPVPEACDGRDNDGDGDVDESFPDADLDGRADCLDCWLADAPPAQTNGVRGCASWTWGMEELWSFDLPDGRCRLTAAADLDDDGYTDLMCSGATGVHAVGGAGGLVSWSVMDAWLLSPVAVGDVDGDGSWNVAYLSAEGEVVLLDSAGDEIWRSISTVEPGTRGQFDLVIADLEGDGVSEVLTNQWVLNGRTGERRTALPFSVDDRVTFPLAFAVADLNGDGSQEIIGDWRVASADGEWLWTVEPPAGWEWSVNAVLLQADSDPGAEVAWVSDNVIVVTDGDGSVIAEIPLLGDRGAPEARSLACAGNLDHSAQMAIVVPMRLAVRAYRPNGDLLWEVPLSDDSTFTACATFDFDGDGPEEVLVTDEVSSRVLRGSDGATLLTAPRLSATVGDLFIPLDLDGDGETELVVSNPAGGGFAGVDDRSIRVYGSTGSRWPPGLTYWAYQGWSGAGIGPHGEVETDPARPWLTTGQFRGQPRGLVSADLRASVVDGCMPEAPEGDAHLAIAVENLGPGPAPAGLAVAVYSVADGSTPLAVVRIEAPIEAGWRSATVEVAVPQAVARAGVRIVPDDDGTTSGAIDDCDASNSSATWSGP